eukprot:TRINITY_DN14427_c0_g1_i1.p1 TRINITY_DN14427_c0_g1~~TRINITY_DN14427_c0_g1_i1.p1  ORF type:complete len:323 (+),score=70.68 TRINITY_DN14427_c0_g1_i1:60-1028(+)
MTANPQATPTIPIGSIAEIQNTVRKARELATDLANVPLDPLRDMNPENIQESIQKILKNLNETKARVDSFKEHDVPSVSNVDIFASQSIRYHHASLITKRLDSASQDSKFQHIQAMANIALKQWDEPSAKRSYSQREYIRSNMTIANLKVKRNKSSQLKDCIADLKLKTTLSIDLVNQTETRATVRAIHPGILDATLQLNLSQEYVVVDHIEIGPANKKMYTIQNGDVFQKVNLCAIETLGTVSKYAPEATLSAMIAWLEPYKDIYSQKCIRCDKILKGSAETGKLTPPTVRRFGRAGAVHEECKKQADEIYSLHIRPDYQN